MGVFSSECESCGKSILSPYVTSPVNEWMSHAVSINVNEEIIMGIYDGYGCIGTAQGALGYGQTIWHRACWEAEDRPGYQGQSKHAEDQGYFFDDEDYNISCPGQVVKRLSKA